MNSPRPLTAEEAAAEEERNSANALKSAIEGVIKFDFDDIVDTSTTENEFHQIVDELIDAIISPSLDSNAPYAIFTRALVCPSMLRLVNTGCKSCVMSNDQARKILVNYAKNKICGWINIVYKLDTDFENIFKNFALPENEEHVITDILQTLILNNPDYKQYSIEKMKKIATMTYLLEHCGWRTELLHNTLEKLLDNEVSAIKFSRLERSFEIDKIILYTNITGSLKQPFKEIRDERNQIFVEVKVKKFFANQIMIDALNTLHEPHKDQLKAKLTQESIEENSDIKIVITITSLFENKNTREIFIRLVNDNKLTIKDMKNMDEEKLKKMIDEDSSPSGELLGAVGGVDANLIDVSSTEIGTHSSTNLGQ